MKKHASIFFVYVALLTPLAVNANICGISAGLMTSAELALKKKCSEITEADLATIKTLEIRNSSMAEKCSRPEAVYSQDLKLFSGVEELIIWSLPMSQADARHYLMTKDDGKTKPEGKSDGRYGPCVLYGGRDKTWPLMFRVIEARGEKGVNDLVESKNEIIEMFPNISTLQISPIQDKAPLEPTLKKLKNLKILTACPSSSDNLETLFSEIQNLEELTLEGCFLASSRKIAPKLGPSEKLKTVTFKENGWSTLPSDYFAATPNLESISLYKNEMGKLPPGLFKDLKNLKQVNLKLMKLDRAEKERVRKELLSASPELKAKKAIQL